MRALTFGLGALLAGCASLLLGARNHQPGRTLGQQVSVTELQSAFVTESSGLARSYTFPGHFYTHNDSGDSARFWRFDLKGKVAGPFVLKGAGASDWEDMASAKIDGKSFLYIADIGDNMKSRKSVQVYKVPEPEGDKRELTTFITYDLTYPEGPQDAEALMVHPKSGDLTIVTKAREGAAKVYVLKDANGLNGGKHVLSLQGSLGPGFKPGQAQLVTGGDYSPDGRHVALRTYFAAYEFPVSPGNHWFESAPSARLLSLELQGEAIAYTLDGATLLTTAEGSPCRVCRIPIEPGGPRPKPNG
jgi:hypothetical protein